MTIESCLTGIFILIWLVVDQLLLSVGLGSFLSGIAVILAAVYGSSFGLKYWEGRSL